MALVEQSSAIVSDPTLKLLTMDPLTSDDYSRGVRFDFDVPFSLGYTISSPVPDQNVVEDLTEHANGRFLAPAGVTPVISGGGVDFGTVSAKNTYFEIPSSVAKTIYDNSQRFLIVVYAKLPASADWNTGGTDLPILSFADAQNGYSAGPDLLQIGLATQSGIKQMFFRRQTALGVVQSSTISSSTLEPFAGQVVQLAFWRTATAQGARLKSATGEIRVADQTQGSDNALDFSNQRGKIGIPTATWGVTLTAAQLLARKFKIYRGFVEALTVSGRDPITVIDSDWARVVQRGAFL